MQTRITKLLGIKYPVIQGGMAWVAEYHLAAAVSEAGGLGIIGAANAPAEWVRDQIRETKKLTDKPFGVNVMLMSPYADQVAQVIAEEGGISARDAVRLVRKRGLLMAHTVPAGEGSMCAVLGMETEAVEQVLAGLEGVTIANYNCPGQLVVTGRTGSVREAAEALKAAGARRVVPLKVSGPFHSPLLKSAGEELAEELTKVEFHELEVPYYANVTAERVTDSAVIPPLLARGVSSSVRWQQSVEAMLADGADTFVEIGPGHPGGFR